MAAYDLNANYADVGGGFVTECRKTLTGSASRIDHCLKQLSDEQIWWRARPEMNAIGNLLLHLCGNMEQWVIAPIENRPAVRNRPGEFTQREPILKAELEAQFHAVCAHADAALATLLTEESLLMLRRVQGHDTVILAAVFHSVTHVEGHAQEIIAMTRQMLGEKYVFQWMPKTPEQVSA